MQVLNSILAIKADLVLQGFPLYYQIGFILLGGLFALSLFITRNPRPWRRLYQGWFSQGEISVNRNKRVDELIKRYGITLASAFLFFSVTSFVLGVTHRYRIEEKPKLTQEQELSRADAQRLFDR